MDLPKNAFKAAISAGRRQIGIWCTLPDANTAELLAGCGYDWMLFDTEHSPMGAVEVMPLLRTVAPYPVSAVVRPGWNDAVEIKKLLDCGAQTLLVPYVQTAEEARAAVAAVRYPPAGIRGVAGTTRASRFGAVQGYARQAAEEICLLVQVETREALSHLDAIAEVEGVDGVFLGPADLSASFGHLGEPSHPEVKAAILDAVRRLKARGVPAGILSVDQPLLREVAEAGASFIAVDLDIALLRRSALARAAEWTS
jgi:4-hydroxy-2-oxoheptanedioate aldolase